MTSTPIFGFSDAGRAKMREMAENSSIFKDYLSFHGRVFKHPVAVSLEFFTQRPEAKFIATQKQWENYHMTLSKGSKAIRFVDKNGNLTELYDFSQIEEEKPPHIWSLNKGNVDKVRAELGIENGLSFIDGISSDSINVRNLVDFMSNIGITPQESKTFMAAYVNNVKCMIAGRLEVGGNSFNINPDTSALKMLKNDTQRLAFLALTAKNARECLMKVESAIQQITTRERNERDEIRRMDESDGRRTGSNTDRRASDSADGNVIKQRNEVGSNVQGRSDGLGSDSNDEEGRRYGMASSVHDGDGNGTGILVQVRPDIRTVQAESDRIRTVDGRRTDRSNGFEVDGIYGRELSRGDRIDAPESSVSDSSTFSTAEGGGLHGVTGEAVRRNESTSPRFQQHPRMGESTSISRRGDSNEGDSISSRDNSVTDDTLSNQNSSDRPSFDTTSIGGLLYGEDYLSLSDHDKITVLKNGIEEHKKEIIKLLNYNKFNESAILSNELNQLNSELKELQERADTNADENTLTADSKEFFLEDYEGTWSIVDSYNENGEDVFIARSDNYGFTQDVPMLKLDRNRSVLDTVTIYSATNPTILFCVEQYNVTRYYSANVDNIDEILRTAANADMPFVELSKLGNSLSPEEYAEIEQSSQLTYSLHVDLNEGTASIYTINGGKGGIPEGYRTDENASTEAVYIYDYRTEQPKINKPVPIYTGEWRISDNKALFREIVAENERFTEMANSVIGNGKNPDDSIKALVDEFGMERTAFLTSLNIVSHPMDGRFYPADKEWACKVLSPYIDVKPDELIHQNPEKSRLFNQMIEGGVLQKIHNTHLAQFAETLIPQYENYLEMSKNEENTEEQPSSAEKVDTYINPDKHELAVGDIVELPDRPNTQWRVSAIKPMQMEFKDVNAPSASLPYVVYDWGANRDKFEYTLISSAKKVDTYINSDSEVELTPEEEAAAPEKSEWRYYVIPDLNTWATNGKFNPMTPIEYYDTFEEAKARFDELRNEPYNSEYSISNGSPSARLTLGIDSEVNKAAVDILHVRADQNSLVDDFTRMSQINENPEAMSMIRKIAAEIGFDVVRSYQKRENGSYADKPVILSLSKWEFSYMLTDTAAESDSEDYYRIYQIKQGDKYHGIRFESLETNKDMTLNVSDYDMVYEGKLSDISGDSIEDKLENINAKFNVAHPDDFRGHSLSVSDVVVIGQNGSETAYYVDVKGFSDMPDFYNYNTEHPVIADFRKKTDSAFNSIDGHSAADIEAEVLEYVKNTFAENGIDAEVGAVIVSGSRCRGLENDDSDIDVVVEVKSEHREDHLFNILHENGFEIGGVAVDINPIRAEETGTLVTYLPEVEKYLADNKNELLLKKAIQLINYFTESEYGSIPDEHPDIENMGLAYTTLTDYELPIQVTADLKNLQITYEFDGELFNVDKFESLEDMIKHGLTDLDFAELIRVPYSVLDKHEEEYKKALENTIVNVEKYGISFDMKDVDSLTLLQEYYDYEGGIDSDGHERKDNYSFHESYIKYYINSNGRIARRDSEDLYSSFDEECFVDAVNRELEEFFDEHLGKSGYTVFTEKDGIITTIQPVIAAEVKTFDTELTELESRLLAPNSDLMKMIENNLDQTREALRDFSVDIIDNAAMDISLDTDFMAYYYAEDNHDRIIDGIIDKAYSAAIKAKTAVEAPAEKKSLTRSERLYKMFTEMYPDLVSGEHSYERYGSHDDNSGYEQLSVEHLGGNEYGYMTSYILNGDLMRDPDFTFALDHENKQLIIHEYQQDGVPPWGTLYQRVYDDNGVPDLELKASLEGNFLLNLQNAKSANRSLTAYNDADGNEVVIDNNETHIDDNRIDDEDFTENIEPAEIVYPKNQMEKIYANISAINELKRIEEAEMYGYEVYDNRSNQPNSRENSDRRLRSYSGWGGLPKAFEDGTWYNKQIKTILTPEEYTAARATTLNAHYTPQVIIDSMYKAVQSMGLSRDSRILEPACGTGNFITRIPHSLGNAEVVGIELDSITARIAKQLNRNNPKVKIINDGFERTALENDSFDLAIGNVPFGDYNLNDPDYVKDWKIHDAFFRRSLDKVASGGVVAFVTSSGTLDKKNPKIREYLASKAELIGAIRLPNNAFSDAGTKVTSDIIFLKKRDIPLEKTDKMPDWCYTSSNEDGLRINNYFVQNPQMILGKMEKTTHFDMLTCVPHEGADLAKQLDEAIKNLNAKITVERRAERMLNRISNIAPWGKKFTYQIKDDKVYFRNNEKMEEIKCSDTEKDMLIKLCHLRTVTRQLLDMQKTTVGDDKLIPLREELNKAYDEYIDKYGSLDKRGVKKLFGDDSDFPILKSLENINTETGEKEKSDIFFRRTVNPVNDIKEINTVEEALQVSLDRKGKPDIPYMTILLAEKYPDMKQEEIAKSICDEMLKKELIFIDPDKIMPDNPYSAVVERSEYLSGNVRQKLAIAENHAKKDDSFANNVEALKKVLPEDIRAEEISVQLGCPWIDASDYTAFLEHLSGRGYSNLRNCDVTYSNVTGEFEVLNAGSSKDLNINETSKYGTSEMNMYKIAERLLNQRRIVVTMQVPHPTEPDKTLTRTNPKATKLAMEKAKVIKEEFKKWIFADNERKAKYERRYNDLFNSLVGRNYDGSNLTFSGIRSDFLLRPHQKNCVARAIYGGNTLAAHVVGAGKSAVMFTTVMKKKEVGLINKACVVVPKPLTEQVANEWRKLYPDAKLLTVTNDDLSSEAKRKLFTARVATGSYDAVIMSQEQFEKIPMSAEYRINYIQAQIDELQDNLSERKRLSNGRKDYSVKQIESAIKKLESKIKSLTDPKSASKAKDDLLDFEQLGFDYLVVDEAHAYKNGFVNTKMQNVSGVTVRPSGRAADMQMKTDYFNEQLGQGHILYCTGTPNATP